MHLPLSLASPLEDGKGGTARTWLYLLWPLLKCAVTVQTSCLIFWGRKFLRRTMVDESSAEFLGAKGPCWR